MVIVPTNRFAIVNNSGREKAYSNLFTQQHHLGIFGSTRSGKSTLLKEVVALALAEGLFVTGLEDWMFRSQTSSLLELSQIKGSLLSIKNAAFNLFQLPDLRHFSEVEQAARLEEYTYLLLLALRTIAVPPQNKDKSFDKILSRALETFFANPEICQRYQTAMEQGSGSKSWLMTPTLVDFLPYCTPEYLSLSRQDAQVCQLIQSNLINCLCHSTGKAISTTSDIPLGIQLMVLAFQDNQIQNTPALTMSALLSVMRRLLSTPKSLLYSDDCYSLLSNPQTAMFITRVCAMGKKFGIQFALSSQDIDGIAPEILYNLDLKLVGKIPVTAIRSFEKAFEYPHGIISRCATSDFNPTQSYTYWLLDGIHRNQMEFKFQATSNLERFTFCRHYLR